MSRRAISKPERGYGQDIMNISRLYLVTGSLYLLIGVVLGIYMNGAHHVELGPVHAEIYLMGFGLMTMFGIAYRVMPRLASNELASAHFWLHQIGGLVMLIGLFLLLSDMLSKNITAMVMPLSAIFVFLGMSCWAVNVFRNA